MLLEIVELKLVPVIVTVDPTTPLVGENEDIVGWAFRIKQTNNIRVIATKKAFFARFNVSLNASQAFIKAQFKVNEGGDGRFLLVVEGLELL